MNLQSQGYINRLKVLYRNYNDNDSLLALADAQTLDERARELRIYREQDKTQELIHGALKAYKSCLEKLTNSETARKMTDEERAYCFAKMDWARFTLDIVGENPDQLEKQVDNMVESFAIKAGIAK